MILNEDYVKLETSMDGDELVYTITMEDGCSLTLNIYELRSLKKIVDKIV